MTIRSKHNDLLNYFLYDDKDLSKAYVRKCKNFIDDIHAKIHIEKLRELTSWYYKQMSLYDYAFSNFSEWYKEYAGDSWEELNGEENK